MILLVDTLQLQGYFRTGTTALRELIDRNFDVEVDGWWKHSPPRKQEDADAVVVTKREPWAWMLSFYRFQRTPFIGKLVDVLYRREIEPYAAVRGLCGYAHALENWRKGLVEKHDNAIWMSHESHLTPHGKRRTVGFLNDELGLPLSEPRKGTDIVEEHKAPMRGLDRWLGHDHPLAKLTRSSSFDPTYYTEGRYIDDIGEEQIGKMVDLMQSRELDEVFSRHGYDIFSIPRKRDIAAQS